MAKVKYKKRYKKRKNPKKKKFRISRKVAKILGTIVISGGFVWFLLFSSFFQVNFLEIYGDNLEIKKQLHQVITDYLNKQKLFFVPTKTIFLLSPSQLSRFLSKNFAEIESIQVYKKYPKTLTLRFATRKPVANFCHDNHCFLMDKNGVIFKQGKQEELPSIINNQISKIKIGTTPLSEKEKDKLWELMTKITNKTKCSIKEIYLENATAEIITKEGWRAILDLEKDISYQTNILALFFENQMQEDRELDYIDLRFDKIFYKFKEKKPNLYFGTK